MVRSWCAGQAPDRTDGASRVESEDCAALYDVASLRSADKDAAAERKGWEEARARWGEAFELAKNAWGIRDDIAAIPARLAQLSEKLEEFEPATDYWDRYAEVVEKKEIFPASRKTHIEDAPHGGCLSLRSPCDDPLTGEGNCEDVVPIVGPCVCAIQVTAPEPPPGGGGDDPPWEQGSVAVDGETIAVYLMPVSETPGSVPLGIIPVPGVRTRTPWRGEMLRVGDVVCAEQKVPIEFEHRYTYSWGSFEPDRIRIEGASFCVEVVAETEGCDGAPGWFGARFTEFQAGIPSFAPAALGGLATGPTTFALRPNEKSGAKFQPSSGIVVVAVRAEARNSLFRGTPVPLNGFLKGRIVYDPSSDSSRLEIIEARFGGMTPEGYQGPLPVD